MNILAVDTAGKTAGVALLQDDRLLYEVYLDAGMTHSETLMPMIDTCLKMCGMTCADIKYRLKHSDKSIKEIAEEFNFPNQSFFGKYVKSYLGMSPARYRNTKEE